MKSKKDKRKIKNSRIPLKKSAFKCEDCDYVCEKFPTKEVHVGKFHGEIVECGLCNFEAKIIESLNL